MRDVRGSRIAAHPAVAPGATLYGLLGIEVDPLALVVLASGFGYVTSTDGPVQATRVADGWFDLLESSGFNCEQFRSADPATFLRAAQRQFELSARRWKATPLLTEYPDVDPATGATALFPAALTEMGEGGVRVITVHSDRLLDRGAFLEQGPAFWASAGPVPSMRSIMAPGRFDFAARARKWLPVLLMRLSVAADGLTSLEALVESQPGTDRLSEIRRRMTVLSNGDDTFFRSALVEAIDRFGPTLSHARDGFAASAIAHREFLKGDDEALVRAAAHERRALDAAGSTAVEHVAVRTAVIA